MNLPEALRKLLERHPNATVYPPVKVSELPQIPEDCDQCFNDSGTCTCTEQCRSILCMRGPWDTGFEQDRAWQAMVHLGEEIQGDEQR
jgi:hypothetical protein